MIAKIGSFLKDDTSDPCFESIRLKTKCYSVFQLHNYNCYLIAVRQYFAIAITLGDQNNAIRLLHIAIILQCMRYIELLPNPNPDVHIREYGSTLYVGMAPKKMATHTFQLQVIT